MKNLLTIAIIAIMTMSCESKSGQRVKLNHTEKVVIIDSKYIVGSATSGNPKTDYKVNRIEEGVVEWIRVNGNINYEKNDTIYWEFANNK
jgi:uncharacterized protein YcfL